LIGKRKRQIAFAYAFMSPAFVMIFMLIHQLFGIGFFILFLGSIPAIGGFYLYLYFKLKSDNRKIQTIGDIEFTRTGIKKHIGDSLSEFSYQSIKSIELQKHIPAVTIAESKSGFFSYLLSITFLDLHKETVVISDLPAGKWQDLSITETIKTLKKITKLEIILK
jgi:uncharacterized membrane protein YciS (DUF1049 family)